MMNNGMVIIIKLAFTEEAVYGLAISNPEIKTARLVTGTGCNALWSVC